MVPPDFGNRRSENDEEMIGFRAGGKRLLNFRLGKDGLRLLPVEQAIQSLFDGRAHQQWVPRVVNAKVDALPALGTEADQLPRHGNQRIDIGEAHQTKTNFLATDRVDRAIQLVQAAQLRPQGLRQFGTDDFALGLGDGQRQDFGMPPCVGARQPGQAFLHETLVLDAVGFGTAVVRSHRRKFIKPGAANIERLAGPALMLLELLPTSQIGLKQAFDQSRRQGCRRKQYPAAQHAGPMHQTAERRQVLHSEIVRLVEHQIGTHQAQHGWNLVTAARAFGGGHQVIDGAHQNGRVEQFAGWLVFAQPAVQRTILQAAVVENLVVFGHQFGAGF